MEKKKYGIDMTADEWFEIEERGMGEEGRELHRSTPSNPYFPAPDMSMWDESLYDGYKIKGKK
mgnify:CR=1 FL=1